MYTIDIRNMPEYFSLLNETDKAEYAQLQKSLEISQNRSSRNKKTTDLMLAIDEIKHYCLRGDSDDCKRCIVCGTCWLSTGLAVNIKQLQCLIQKCKSSINTTLRKMGYELTNPRGDVSDELAEYLPMFRGKQSELRKWSIRTPPNWCGEIYSNKNSNENVINQASEHSSPLSPSQESSFEQTSTEQLRSPPEEPVLTWEYTPNDDISAWNFCDCVFDNQISEQTMYNIFDSDNDMYL